MGKWGNNLTFWGDNSIYHWLGPTLRDVEGEGSGVKTKRRLVNPLGNWALKTTSPLCKSIQYKEFLKTSLSCSKTRVEGCEIAKV